MRFPVRFDFVDAVDSATPQNSSLYAVRAWQAWGATLAFKLDDGISAEDLSGRSFRFVILDSQGGANALLSGTSSDTSGVGGVALAASGGANGQIAITIPAATTGTLRLGRWWWVLLDTTAGKNEGMGEGLIDVIQGVPQ